MNYSKLKTFLQRDRPSLKPKLNAPLINPQSYWNIIGGAGSGKTTLIDQLFILDFIESSTKIYWIYHSLERPTWQKLVKWLSHIIFKKEGIIWDYNTIVQNSLKLETFTDRHWKVLDFYGKYLDEKILTHATIIDDTYLVEKMYNNLATKYAKVAKDYDIVIHITDHIGRIKSSKPNVNDFQAISLWSDRVSKFRDKNTKFVGVDIQQMNGSKANDAYRRKSFGAEVLFSDAYGGQTPYQNADVAGALVNPYAMGTATESRYDLTKLVIGENDNRFRKLSIYKATNGGIGDYYINLLGEVALFEQYPLTIKDYEYYKNPFSREGVKTSLD